MLLTLSVISENAAQLGLDGYKVFDERGGDIGRLESSHWMLRDPNHLVSARHAHIFFGERGFFLEDTSTNGTFVNDPERPAPRDAPLPLHDGDRLFIGSFEILVQLIEELPVVMAPTRGSEALDLPELSVGDRTDSMRGVPATPAANPVATQTLARSQTSPPLQSWPRAKSWPAETDPQLESIAHIAVEGAMRALRIRDQALRGLGIPTEGPRAPALDPLATWPRPDQAARRLVSSDPAQRLPLEPLASAFWEIGVHEAATLAAIRAACDALIAHLAPRRGAEGQLRALFATEFANTYAAHIYRLRSSPPRV